MSSSTAALNHCAVCDKPIVGSNCLYCGWDHNYSGNRGLSSIPTRFSPTAKRLLDSFQPATAPNPSNPVQNREIEQQLQRWTNLAEQRLVEAGWQANSVGFGTVDQRGWQHKRERVTDTQLYDYLLRDTVEVALTYWAVRLDYSTVDALVAGETDDNTPSSADPLFDVYDWLLTIDAPTDCENHQVTISNW